MAPSTALPTSAAKKSFSPLFVAVTSPPDRTRTPRRFTRPAGRQLSLSAPICVLVVTRRNLVG
jgi:hypothetical protein